MIPGIVFVVSVLGLCGVIIAGGAALFEPTLSRSRRILLFLLAVGLLVVVILGPNYFSAHTPVPPSPVGLFFVIFKLTNAREIAKALSAARDRKADL